MVKKQKILYLKNELGLHIRPAAAIVKLLQNYTSKVFFTHNGETVNAKSVMSLLMLTAKKNEKITVTVEGDDAEEVMKQLIKAFEKHLGENI